MERRLSEPRPEYVALGVVAMGRAHGYELYRLFDRLLGGVWHISQSQFYATLKRLESKGWAQGAEAGPVKHLSLTEEGRSAFLLWLERDSVPSARIIRLEFVSRLCFAEQLGWVSARSLAQSQATAIQAESDTLAAELGQLDDNERYRRMGAESRLRQLDALQAWINELERRLT